MVEVTSSRSYHQGRSNQDASWRRHPGGGITKEVSLRRPHGTGAWRRYHTATRRSEPHQAHTQNWPPQAAQEPWTPSLRLLETLPEPLKSNHCLSNAIGFLVQLLGKHVFWASGSNYLDTTDDATNTWSEGVSSKLM